MPPKTTKTPILGSDIGDACSQDPNEVHVNALVDYAYGSDGDFVIIDGKDVGAVSNAQGFVLVFCALE